MKPLLCLGFTVLYSPSVYVRYYKCMPYRLGCLVESDAGKHSLRVLSYFRHWDGLNSVIPFTYWITAHSITEQFNSFLAAKEPCHRYLG